MPIPPSKSFTQRMSFSRGESSARASGGGAARARRRTTGEDGETDAAVLDMPEFYSKTLAGKPGVSSIA